MALYATLSTTPQPLHSILLALPSALLPVARIGMALVITLAGDTGVGW